MKGPDLGSTKRKGKRLSLEKSGHEFQTELRSHLFAQILPDDLPDFLHAALRSAAVEHLQGGRVLFGQQVVQSPQVLAHFDESPTVGAAQVPKTLRRSPVHLTTAEEEPVNIFARNDLQR